MKYKDTQYEITTDGKVLNGKGNEISKYNLNGYVYTTLSIKGKRKQIGVHRLVAEVYMENFTDSCVITHINGNKSDNRLENLQIIEGRIKIPNNDAIEVLQLDLENNVIYKFKSVYAAAKSVEGFKSSIKSAIDKDREYKGYKWKYNK